MVPIINPDFDPAKYQPELEASDHRTRQTRNVLLCSATKETSAVADDEKAMQVWKARVVRREVEDGKLIVIRISDKSFLGFQPPSTAGRVLCECVSEVRGQVTSIGYQEERRATAECCIRCEGGCMAGCCCRDSCRWAARDRPHLSTKRSRIAFHRDRLDRD